ncbi:MAG: hypothetical protein RIK87_00440 [Fuerstiella sp.]
MSPFNSAGRQRIETAISESPSRVAASTSEIVVPILRHHEETERERRAHREILPVWTWMRQAQRDLGYDRPIPTPVPHSQWGTPSLIHHPHYAMQRFQEGDPDYKSSTAELRVGLLQTAVDMASMSEFLITPKLNPGHVHVYDAAPKRREFFSSGSRASQMAPDELLQGLKNRGYEVFDGPDIQRHLNRMGANASTFGTKDLLLRPDPRKLEVIEEWLHNVQQRIGIDPAIRESHIADFIHRHRRLLGLDEADTLKRLQIEIQRSGN